MNKMKKCIVSSIILGLALPTLSYAEATAGCVMQYQNARAGNDNPVPVFSDHIFRITNDTGIAKSYHVQYENFIMFTSPYYTPHARFDHNFALNNGQTLQATLQRINRNIRFSEPGNYPTLATTKVFMDGKLIAQCENKSVAAIF